MVAVAFSFPLGRYHATAWGTNVNEAAVDWPPSPWRILRALLAAGRDGDDDAAIGGALNALVAAGDPVYELPPVTAGHTRHYVPLTEFDKGGPPKTSLVIDAFMALGTHEEVRVFWDADLGEVERTALAAAARRVGYLGRSESVCDARLLPADTRPHQFSAWPEALAIDGAPGLLAMTTLMTVASDASEPVAILETDVGAMRKTKRLVPQGTRQVRYALRADRPEPWRAPVPADAPTLVVLRIAGNALPELTRGVVVTAVLRRALLRIYDHDKSGRISAALSGHDPNGPSARQHRHAHYLAIPDATGSRIDRLAAWTPDGFGPEEIRALATLSSLRLREMPEPLRVALVSAGPAEQALPGLARASATWETITPMVLPRHMKRGRERDAPEAQVLAELAHRGLPAPAAIEELVGAWGRFARDRPGQSQQRTKTAVGFRLRFDNPVAGPIVLGANCHFGLGLMRPAP